MTDERAAIDFRARGSVPEIDERAFQDAALTARHQSLRAAGMREDLPATPRPRSSRNQLALSKRVAADAATAIKASKR
jgi:hypothetical protein